MLSADNAGAGKVSSVLLWSRVCKLFELCASQQARSIKSQVEALLNEYSKLDSNLYKLIALLCPSLDNCKFFLKEAGVAKLLTNALEIPRHVQDAKALAGWKTPEASAYGQGNFGNVAYSVLKKQNGSSVSFVEKKCVRDFNEFLTQLELISRAGGVDVSGGQAEFLRRHLMDYSALEWKWIVRVILRDISVGISEALVLLALHPDATKLYMVHSNNMQTVCNMLRDPKTRIPLESTVPKLVHLFMPQAAEQPASLLRIAEVFHKKPFYIEAKMDGERLQLHKQGSIYRLFSRKGTDYTHLYGSVICNIVEKDLIPLADCILDGELVGYNPAAGCWMPFGTLKSIARATGGSLKRKVHEVGEEEEEEFTTSQQHL
jgi:DNA ligase-4